jgi:hypothetical protein
MKASKKVGGIILAAATFVSLAACSYHERTVVERPVVVPEAAAPAKTVIVPEGSSAVIVPPSN